MSDTKIKSILAADFGSVNTRALLFDVVEGEYRLVAQGRSRTTIGSPVDDAHIGLSSVLREMAVATGRRFLDEQGSVIRPEQANRVGVDYYVTTASAGQALRMVLVGLYPGHDLGAAQRAIAPFYIKVAAAVHLEDGLGPKGRLNRIVHSRPQLILVTGGTDGGVRAVLLEMLSVVRQAVALLPMGSRPTVIFAGNSSLTTAVREMLSQQAEVLIAPNIVGGGENTWEAAQTVLASVLGDHKWHGRSFQRVAAMTDSGISPTARGVETMTAFFSRALQQDVLAIDIGSARSTLSLAGNGRVWTGIHNDIGMGHSAASALELIGEEAVSDWLPFYPRKGELAQYVLNKGLRLENVPREMRERTIDYALLRAGLRYMLRAARESGSSAVDPARVGMVLVAGAAMTGGGQGALDMLMLSDALQCAGVLRVKADPHGALSALGALATRQPMAVVQLANSVLEDVGTLICASGKSTADATALKVSVRLENGELLRREIADGDVWRLPLESGATAEVRIQARRGLTVGGKRRLRLQLTGGRGGLLFDARLDSLEKESSLTVRAVNMLRWFAAVSGADEPVVIPESWLATAEVVT